MGKKVYNSIDIAKFFFCSCIIALHTDAFKDLLSENIYWYIEHCIFRLAVPFFFVASGFMIGTKINKNPLNVNNYVKQYIKRLLIPLIVFEFINIILEIIKMVLDGTSFKVIILTVGRSVIFYPFGALWYVQASIVAICLLYFFIKRNLINRAIIIGLVLYIFALISNSYYFLVEGTTLGKIIDLYLYLCVSARNGLFVGFIFIGLGIWISNNINELQSGKKIKYSVICFVASLITLFIEVSYIYGKDVADDSSMFVSLIVLLPSLLVLLTYYNCNLSNKTAVLARNLSTGMYFLHRAILSSIIIVCTITGYTFSTILTFILVYIFCALICLVSYKYKVKPLVNLLK